MKIVQAVILCMIFAIISMTVSPIVVAEKVSINTVETKSCEQSGGKVATEDDDSKKIKKGDCVGGNSVTSVFATVTNILLFLVGAVAVIMLVVGGFKYVTSNGDQNAIASAKNTILYAIIGIVVAFLAYAAVAFVAGQF